MGKTFEGLKIIEMAGFVAAPTAGRIFTDLGAEVIKIETAEGDAWRKYVGPKGDKHFSTVENPIWETYNGGKKCIVLNVQEPEGKEILFKLLEDADVLITNTRVKALKKQGLDYDSIKDRFPKLVYAMVTGYGTEGPDANTPGYDTVAFWARTGLAADVVPVGGKPIIIPGSIGDGVIGMGLFGGICAALAKRGETGKGDLVELSIYGTAIWALAMMGTLAEDVYGNVYPKNRYEGDPLITTHVSKDNESFTLTVIDVAKYYKPMCEAFGHVEIAEKYPDYLTIQSHKPEIFPMIEGMFAEHDYAEIDKILTDLNITHQKLGHYKDLSKDPQAFANNYVREFTFDSGEKYIQFQQPIRLRSNDVTPLVRGGKIGEHNNEVLKGLGYTEEQIKALKDKGVI